MPVTPPNQLFPPNRSGGKGVLNALAARKTTREIAQTPLPAQLLSDLLWAANGVNRDAGPFSGAGRTAASAGNSQEIELYLSTAAGSSLYEPSEHRLHKVEERDVRGLGLMVAAEFVRSREDKTPHVKLRDVIIEEAYKRGLLLLPCGKSAIRFIPPLVIQRDEIDEGVEILDAALTAARRRG